MYKKVSTNLNFVEREKETAQFWKDHDIFKKSIETREGDPVYTFYDGPPTANGKPHIGHVLTRVIKDMTVEQWCDTKGISKSNYYYRLRCIRKACLEHVQDNSVSCQQVVEIPEKITQQSRSESPSDISIEINGAVIHIKEDISESLLEKIIRVVSRAK